MSNYLLNQYFVMKSGGTPDWELKGLHALYQSLDLVKNAFINRVRLASAHDSNLNAICGFGTFSARLMNEREMVPNIQPNNPPIAIL